MILLIPRRFPLLLLSNMSSPTSHNLTRELHTPQKARVRSSRKDSGMTYQAIEHQTGIPHATGEKTCKASSSRRNTHVPDWKEGRGRPQLLSLEVIRKCEHILEDHGIEGEKLSWEGLSYEAGRDVSAKTKKRAMGTLNYHMCIVCRKGWVNPALQKKRKAWCEIMFSRFPNQKDWYHLR